MKITENQLDEWVRANARDAQGVIVELVWRLVAASCPRPRERRFPLGDSIGQHGPDGILDVDLGYDPFVPDGRSFWEVGTNLRAGDKATSDYNGLTDEGIPESTLRESTFIFVTPLSGRRDWEHTWKEDAQGAWIEKRRSKGQWRDVRVIDGTKLIDWLHQFPPVALWLEQKTLGLPTDRIETPEQHWELLRSIGEPPSLTPKVFLAGREEACEKLKEIVAGKAVQLKIDTHYPDQVVDFVCAYLAELDHESRVDAAGRCLVVSGVDAWNTMTVQRENLILIADSSLDLGSDLGTKLIQKARRSGHAVIYGGPAGGIPDPTQVPLRAPRTRQLQEALEHAGYNEERARTLAQKSGGNLGSLLRCLQNLSLIPQWAEGSAAAELAVAELLGAWNDGVAADRSIVEGLSGNSYGEWIGRMRDVALYPGTPLTQRDGQWRFAARYEGWYALGPRFFDEHLDRLKIAVVSVLAERDPQFSLPKEERYASRFQGKDFVHSQLLRKGLAETLALLGSHPRALASCTLGNAEGAAAFAVRTILKAADWQLWASLNDLLPLLAEAAPGEFLDAVEKALIATPGPFDDVFAQEGDDGFMGRTYMSGLLWALETLAWDPNLLSRVVICLGELATRDPGGRWANRPANSLTTILLPWLPQTCAPVTKRVAAVALLLEELPDIGWKTLISLLPQSHSTSSGARRPAWRETIPDDWSKGVTVGEYWEQASHYSQMAIAAAIGSCDKLVELINHMERLAPEEQNRVIDYLGSEAVITMPEPDRLTLWTELVDLVTKHRKYSDTDWAMDSRQVDKVAAIAYRLAPDAPVFRHQRLFSERDHELFEENGNYEDQRKELDIRRQRAVEEIATNEGSQAVLTFAALVKSPWRVGIAFGTVASPEADHLVLPDLLESEQRSLTQFAGGFVWSRFFNNGWPWVDEVETSSWSPSQIGQFLSCLPFEPNTWERSKRLLGEDEAAYWSKTSANPYDTESKLDGAAELLIRYQRPFAALRCLTRMLHDKKALNTSLAYQALMAALHSSEGTHSMDAYDTVAVIKALQGSPETSPDELFQIEWAYLRLLDRYNDASPKLLWRRLATEPEFFCEVIRLIFRSKKETELTEEPTEEAKTIATQAYRLLSQWQMPPGQSESGAYNGELLNTWLATVKAICFETGHLEIAMTMLGHVLIYAPTDSDGLWIHRSVAKVLNAKDAGDMRDGFRTELYNSRGAHWVDPSGAPERELASKYYGKAEAVEAAGFHRLATVLRELAASYEYDAQRVVAQARRDD